MTRIENEIEEDGSVVAFEVAGARVTLSTESIKANWLKNLTAKPEPVPGIPGLFLAYGEHYAGVILGKDGAPNYHLILLPGDENEITWDKAKEWAASINGELPTRREQALLYANLPEQFEKTWYWSSEQSASNSFCAWGQDVSDGGQDGLHKGYELRARAVRRLKIQ